jgi:hypothetical protein
MGTTKDTYDILSDLWDRLRGGPRRKRLHLSQDLGAIAALLDAACSELQGKRVPRREAKELATVINHAKILAVEFKQDFPDLAVAFAEHLPKVGRLLRDADFFIDERPRYRLHATYDTRSPTFPVHAERAIREACEEMQRAAGTLSAYSRRFQQESEK